MDTPNTKSKRRSSGQQPKRPQGATHGGLATLRRTPRCAKGRALLDVQWLRRIQCMVRCISHQLDDLELIFRAPEWLESKQAMRRWFNGVVFAVGARPIDRCRTAQGRHAVLRELARIEHGVHS